MKEYKETQHSIHYKSLSDLSFYSAGYEKCNLVTVMAPNTEITN